MSMQMTFLRPFFELTTPDGDDKQKCTIRAFCYYVRGFKGFAANWLLKLLNGR
jgi:hypothetical protein